jgi:hypothetical protein
MDMASIQDSAQLATWNWHPGIPARKWRELGLLHVVTRDRRHRAPFERSRLEVQVGLYIHHGLDQMICSEREQSATRDFLRD